MLVVENNRTHVQWRAADAVNPISYGGEVVIVFDPGKTNMAMIIGTPDGTVLNHIEFSGNNRGNGPVMDTTIYCNEVKEFLRKYLQKARIWFVATEATILKKGRDYYHSNQVLNEVRANLLQFFLSEYGIHVEEINNWSWKSHILPEGYRSQKFKGSKKWFHDVNPTSPYNFYFNADMTDCVCIYWYVVEYMCTNYTMICNRSEVAISQYKYTIVPKSFSTGSKVTVVQFNNVFSLAQNIAYYTNRILHSFVMEVPVDCFELKDIYGNVQMFEKGNLWDKTVKVVVCRT